MTKDVIPNTRGKSYQQQQENVSDLGALGLKEYEIPDILTAVACIFAECFTSGKRIFANNSENCTYTRCKENIEGYQTTVGGFTLAGLNVLYSDDVEAIGAAVLRKF